MNFYQYSIEYTIIVYLTIRNANMTIVMGNALKIINTIHDIELFGGICVSYLHS